MFDGLNMVNDRLMHKLTHQINNMWPSKSEILKSIHDTTIDQLGLIYLDPPNYFDLFGKSGWRFWHSPFYIFSGIEYKGLLKCNKVTWDDVGIGNLWNDKFTLTAKNE